MIDDISMPRLQEHVPTPKHERIATACVCCGSEKLKKSPAILMPFVAHRVFDWKPVDIDASWGLHTIKNGHAYSICNSLCCGECGCLFLDIRFSEAELHSLYQGYRNEEYTALRETYEPGYAKRNELLSAGVDYIAKIEQFLMPHLSFPVKVLDWGGDTGKNTPFKDRSEFLHIYDISHKPVIHGAEPVDKETACGTGYDLIVCSNVLEHVSYPSELMMELKHAMQKNTILYIEVPYEDIIRTSGDSKDTHLKKKHWHEHINFYTEASLFRLLNLCGLDVVSMQKLNASAEGSGGSFLFQIACKLKT
ncbi:MAG: class I SAM-dependent methyltransferase [Burkholderiales bacterium]